MTKEEVLSKVRKLFELSKSPNENEAALAASKARELLFRYNLRMADLPEDDMKSALDVTEAGVEAGKLLRNWVKGLLIHVAEGFDCSHIIRRRTGCNPVLSFIGTDADTRVAACTFQFLCRELNRMADSALPRLRREARGWSTGALRFAYLEGGVKRIGERFREQTREVKEAEQRTCKDLVLAKERMIRNYMNSTFTSIRKEYGRTRTVSSLAFEKGYKDAERVDLRPGEKLTRRPD